MRGRTLGLAAAVAAGLAVLGFALHRRRPQPLPAGTGVAVRGQSEADLTPEGRLIPVFAGRGRKAGLCFSPPPEVDTSRWAARFSLQGERLGGGRWREPAVRMESTLCFDTPLPPRPQDGPVDLCITVRTGEEGPELRPVCRPVRFAAEPPELAALKADAYALLARSSQEALPAWLAGLDALVARIHRAGFPLYAVQVEMVGINVCRRAGTPEALREARRRLAALPGWLDQPAASWSAGQAAQEAAALELADGNHLERAWSELRRAEERYSRIASSYRFTVAVQQADLLALVGSSAEAADRLRAALADCARSPCDRYLLPSAHGELAWLILLDPDAPPSALREAEELLRQALASPQAEHDRQENVNWLVNLAYLEVRAGRSPAASLHAARTLLGRPETGWERTLLGWSDLVEGWGALRDGAPARALALCNRWTGIGASPQLASQALSCAGAAYRRQGERERALWSFDQAILLYEEAGPAQLGQRLPLGSGQRADDYYEAVRLAVDLGEPLRAWELLERLDGLAANEEEQRLCLEGARDPALARRWAETASERDRLLARVLALDLPASGERRRQLESVRRGLKEKLQELARRSLPCAAPVAAPVRPAAYRAVPLREEVLLLARDAGGGVVLDHRTPFDRGALRRTVERIARELESRTLGDEEWRTLLAPLAAALLPRQRKDLQGVLLYALHGPLQGVPLAALPVARPPGDPPLWLSDLATVAVLPAGLRPVKGGSTSAPALNAAPLFVVDPRGDLPGGGDLAGLYAGSFPGAKVLRGEAAARRPFREGLRRATLLHLDTHGLYDPAFPELSSLLLADGPMTLSELAGLPVPRDLVNLSGCRTGEWPVTADSGQYGLAGLFARRGAAWVVASRSDLDDGVASDFNRVFYTEMKAGRGVVESYARALAALRRHRPAASWGGLLLLRGAVASASPGKEGRDRYSLEVTGRDRRGGGRGAPERGGAVARRLRAGDEG